jgi:hypothetical protein
VSPNSTPANASTTNNNGDDDIKKFVDGDKLDFSALIGTSGLNLSSSSLLVDNSVAATTNNYDTNINAGGTSDVNNISELGTGYQLSSFGQAEDLALFSDEKTLYLACRHSGTDGGVLKLDVSDTNNIKKLNEWQLSGSGSEAVAISPGNDIVYVGDSDNGKIKVYNANFTSEGMAYVISKTSISGKNCKFVSISDSRKIAYVFNQDNTLSAIDISNPFTPEISSTYNVGFEVSCAKISSDETKLFVAGPNKIVSLDVTDLSNIAQISSYSASGASDLSLSSDDTKLYAASADNGVLVFDIDADGNLTYTTFYNTTEPHGLYLQNDGRKLFVADGISGLAIIDLTSGNISHPVNWNGSNNINLDMGAQQILVFSSETVACVNDSNYGIVLIDLTNNEVKSVYSDVKGFNKLISSPDFKTLYAVKNGLYGIDVSDINSPHSIFGPPRAGVIEANFESISADGTKLYLCSPDGSFQILDLNLL